MAEIGPNWNAGGWADNGPGTGGWDPKAATPTKAAPASQASKKATPTAFDYNKYQADMLQYPIDLTNPTGEYGDNYVVFYINIAEDSKLLKQNPSLAVSDSTPRDYDGIAALSNKYKAGPITTVAASVLPAAGGLAALSALTPAGAAAVATGAVVAEEVLKNNASTFSGQKRRLKTAIALHTPNTMSTTYSVNYEEENLDIYALGLAALGGSAAGAKAIQQKGAMSVINEALKDKNIQSAALSAGLSLPGTGGIQKLTGLAPNPRKEQLFKNVNFRIFTFDYQFYPRTPAEAQEVEKIIYEFKYHMHPEFKDANNFLYVYPSEFDIFYYNGAQENLHVNRHTSCVLTDMVVNYAPNGQFTSFADGMPTQINITLTFKELALLTKDKIEAGL
jgi:hypothetical protein